MLPLWETWFLSLIPHISQVSPGTTLKYYTRSDSSEWPAVAGKQNKMKKEFSELPQIKPLINPNSALYKGTHILGHDPQFPQ